MQVQCVLLTETKHPWARFIERLMFDPPAIGLLRGHVATTINGGHSALSTAESLVRAELANGWLSLRRTEEI